MGGIRHVPKGAAGLFWVQSRPRAFLISKDQEPVAVSLVAILFAWPCNIVLLLEPAIEPFPDARIDIEGLLYQGLEHLRSDNDRIAAGLLCKRRLVFRITAHVAERLRELIHQLCWRVGVQPDDHIKLTARAERDLIGFPLRARRRLAVQRDVHVLHAWKIGPARVSDDVAMLIEHA